MERAQGRSERLSGARNETTLVCMAGTDICDNVCIWVPMHRKKKKKNNNMIRGPDNTLIDKVRAQMHMRSLV